MTGYFVITIIALIAIGVGAHIMFKRMDDRYK
ncbi:hypothetical protein BH10ACT7_BH10ACT7_20720 [soil metagenome]